MTTDQVVVYGGNDGTAENYNTVVVDRGDGPGQEQVVQAVGLTTTASGSLAALDDVVVIDASGCATVSFIGSGTYTDVSVKVDVGDGTTWTGAGFQVVGSFGSQPIAPGDQYNAGTDVTFRAIVGLDGCSHARIRCVFITDGAVTVSAQSTLAAQAPSSSVIVTGTGLGGTVPVGGSVSIDGAVTLSTITAGSPTAIAALDEIVQTTSTNGIMIQVTGDLVGTLVAEVSLDGSTFVSVASAWLLDIETGAAGALDSAGVWLVNIAGPMVTFQVRCSAYTSGTATVTLSASSV